MRRRRRRGGPGRRRGPSAPARPQRRRSATGIDVRVASAPSGGPPATWPMAFAWLFIDSTVARVEPSRLRLSHVASIGTAEGASRAPRSHTQASTSHRFAEQRDADDRDDLDQRPRSPRAARGSCRPPAAAASVRSPATRRARRRCRSSAKTVKAIASSPPKTAGIAKVSSTRTCQSRSKTSLASPTSRLTRRKTRTTCRPRAMRSPATSWSLRCPKVSRSPRGVGWKCALGHDRPEPDGEQHQGHSRGDDRQPGGRPGRARRRPACRRC